MNRLNDIKIAFMKWFHAHAPFSMLEVCQQLQGEPKRRGYSYETINSYFPLKESTIRKKENQKADENRNEEQRLLLMEKLKEIIQVCGYELLFTDEKNPDSCLNSKGELAVRFVRMVKESEKVCFLYYLTSNHVTVREDLRINFDTNELQLQHKTDGNIIELAGTVGQANQSVYIFTMLNKDGNPFWYITYNKSKRGKDFRLSFYLKISGRNSEPTVGEAIIVEQHAIQGQEREMDDFAAYVLFNKRKQIPESKFFFKDIMNDDIPLINFPHVKNWHSIQFFRGSWEVYFINPVAKRFERSALRIDGNGHVTMWVKSNTTDPYHGICKKINDLLVIKYDHLIELDDYRSSIVVESNGYSGQLYNEEDDYSTLYGVLGCIERNKAKPTTTKVVLRKISETPMPYIDAKIEVKQLPLEKPENIERLENLLSDTGLSPRFFYGSEKADYMSTDWIRSILSDSLRGD